MIMKMEHSNKIKAVLFDLDGTLTDTLEDLWLSTNYALEYFNYPTKSYEEMRTIVGNGVVTQMNKSCPKDCSNVDEVMKVYKEYYEKHSLDHIRVYDGIIDTIKSLRAKGIKIGIVTNKFKSGVDAIYQKFFVGLVDYCLGEDPRVRRKPAPDMLQLACKDMDVKLDEIIYIGDTEVDIKFCQNAGIECISCLWGFRTFDELKENGGTIFIKEPHEILNFI